jgi:hypothetical protein
MGLVVAVQDEKETAVSEMSVLDIEEYGTISEMVTEPAKLDSIHPGWGAKGRTLSEAVGDESPEFAVIRIEEGWSRSKRLYGPAFLDNVAEQVNDTEPVGHLGHIPDDQESTALPEVQTTWFGAFTRTEPSKLKERKGQDVRTIYVAGYNLPGAKVRQYIKSRAVRGVSWWGRGTPVPIPGKGVEIKNFTLKALDWARKNAEGMPTSGVVAIASEMEGRVADKALSTVTPEEFKQENPNGYALLRAEVVGEMEDKISEQEKEIEVLKKDTDLLGEVRKALKIGEGDDPLTAIANAMSKLGEKAKETLKAQLDKLLVEKVPDAEKRALILKVLPVGEMESKLADAKDEDAEKIVSEMVDAEFDTNDVVKHLVGEQQAPTVRRRDAFRGGSDKDNSTQGRKRVLL